MYPGKVDKHFKKENNLESAISSPAGWISDAELVHGPNPECKAPHRFGDLAAGWAMAALIAMAPRQLKTARFPYPWVTPQAEGHGTALGPSSVSYLIVPDLKHTFYQEASLITKIQHNQSCYIYFWYWNIFNSPISKLTALSPPNNITFSTKKTICALCS